MTDVIADLARFQSDAEAAFAAATTPETVETARVEFLGRSGRLSGLQDAFKAAPPEQKRTIGPAFNAAKAAAETAWKTAQARTAISDDGAPLDISLPAERRTVGALHPLARLGRRVEDVFASLGFGVIGATGMSPK